MGTADSKNLLGSKDKTYRWDDTFGSDGYLLRHGRNNPDAKTPHLPIHPKGGKIIRIFFGKSGGK